MRRIFAGRAAFYKDGFSCLLLIIVVTLALLYNTPNRFAMDLLLDIPNIHMLRIQQG